MKKRTFLVSGASKGIGRALSERLAAGGHHVIGLARNADDPAFPGSHKGNFETVAHQQGNAHAILRVKGLEFTTFRVEHQASVGQGAIDVEGHQAHSFGARLQIG